MSLALKGDEIAKAISGEELRKLGVREIVVAREQRALVYVKDLPRPRVLAEGKHKLPKDVLEVVLVSVGLKQRPYGIPKGTVFENLGFSGLISVVIGRSVLTGETYDAREELEAFVEAVVRGRGVRTLEELVFWLRDDYLIPAFKKVLVAEKKLDEEAFRKADHDKLAEEVRSEVNRRLARECGLMIQKLSIIHLT